MRESTLSQEDKRKLTGYLKPSAHNKIVLILFVVVSTLIIWGLRFFLKELGEKTEFFDKYLLGWTFPLVSTLLIIILARLSNMQILRDLKSGIKYIDTREITELALDKREGYAYPGGPVNKTITGSRIEYKIKAEELFGLIKGEQFETMKPGDNVLVEFAPKSKLILKIEKLEQ